ncbi:hypothetical protein LSAT2_000236 [Lamellibrachia satsuma]|nr:hypothetical protein LSAT2_000236 [Lamellibrachia satsuma]
MTLIFPLLQVAYSYTYELRPYLDLLLQMLLLEDSWQQHRIHNALKGIPDDRDGLFDTIQRSKNHYQKRAYQCIKMMVLLFTHCAPAAQMLQTNVDLRRKWTWAVEWLNEELERRHYSGTSQYPYSNWSPPAQSNETSNGYFLERSHSARMTLAKACELVPEEEPEDQEGGEDKETPTDAPATSQPPPTQDDKVKVPATTHALSPPVTTVKQSPSPQSSMQVGSGGITPSGQQVGSGGITPSGQHVGSGGITPSGQQVGSGGITPSVEPPNVESTEPVTTSKVLPSTSPPPMSTTTTTTTTDSVTKVNEGSPSDNVGGPMP